VLDAIAQYWPVAAINGLAAVTFMIGYVLFGVAMTKNGDPASLVRRARRGGRPGPSAGLGHFRPRFNGRMVAIGLGRAARPVEDLPTSMT
jgi:hypothetical protein